MASTDKLKIRANIKFCVDLGKTPTETFKLMKTTPRSRSVSRALVFRWHKKFTEGYYSLEDEKGRGRKTVITSDVVTSVHDALSKDRRLTVNLLSNMTGLSVGTVHTILTEHLKMSKVCARWVPRKGVTHRGHCKVVSIVNAIKLSL